MRAKVIIVVLLFAAAPFTFALSVTELDVNVGLLLIGSAPPAGYGGPSPLLQTFGASLPMGLGGPWYLEPSIEFFGTYYEWTGTRAVPTAYETGAGFFTIGSLITLQLGAMFPVSSAVKMGGSLGVDFLLRFPAELSNNSSSSIAGRSPSLTYFYTNARFILPETRFVVRWQVVDAVGLVFTLRAMYPIFHLWDEEGLPFYDQFMAGLDIGFVIGLGGKPAANSGGAK